MREPLEAVVAAAEASAADRGVHLSLTGDVDIRVHGDTEQIRIAVAKLVDNAVAYSPDGGSVTIAVRAAQDGGTVEIRVIDCG